MTRDPRRLVVAVARAAITAVPLLLWMLYVATRVEGNPAAGRISLGLPFIALVRHLADTLADLRAGFGTTRLFELLAPLSLTVQAAYLLCRPRLDDRVWRMGVGFALLFFFLAAPAFVEQIGYCRIALPLTISFNVLLARDRGPRFAALFAAGNAGLAWAALRMMQDVL